MASLEEEIEIFGNQMANLGVDIVPYETSNPYFATQSDMITSNCTNQQGLPNLDSGNASVNEACCSHMEMLHPGTDEISQGYFDSSIIERLLTEELNQDYYLHEELSQDCYLQSLWMKNAAP